MLGRWSMLRDNSVSSAGPDFYLGAHAAVVGCPILTRDAGRYRSDFPSVRLITP